VNAPLFVPKQSTITTIRRGSAIVGGLVLNNGRQMVYYKSNKYNAWDANRYVVRCLQAHSCMVHKYSSTAKMAVDPDEFLTIGEYDPVRCAVSVFDAPALLAWLQVETLLPAEVIYRNPLQVVDLEHFTKLADTEQPGEFHIALAGGLKSVKQIRWTGLVFVIENEIDDTLQTVEPEQLKKETQIVDAMQRHAFYFSIPNVVWGTGW
jgi:hypothetical protein